MPNRLERLEHAMVLPGSRRRDQREGDGKGEHKIDEGLVDRGKGYWDTVRQRKIASAPRTNAAAPVTASQMERAVRGKHAQQHGDDTRSRQGKLALTRLHAARPASVTPRKTGFVLRPPLTPEIRSPDTHGRSPFCARAGDAQMRSAPGTREGSGIPGVGRHDRNLGA